MASPQIKDFDANQGLFVFLGGDMKIFIYGDSNTWGQMTNVNGYNKDAIIEQYPSECIWWKGLSNQNTLIINGMCGRSINNEHQFLKNRNAMQTISTDLLAARNADVVILQLGTNDCKSQYNLSAQQIANNMGKLISLIKAQCKATIVLLSPPKICNGNVVTDKYYIGAESKSVMLDSEYAKLAKNLKCEFVSCLNAEVGEDGEHLTPAGHLEISKKVQECINKLQKNTKNLNDLTKLR